MDKKDKTGPADDRIAASSCAAYSLSAFFKKKHWEIVSYFPNCICHSRVKAASKNSKTKPASKKRASSKSKAD